MTAAPEIKGWCPGALRPMLSGDGLVVRIRPPMGRLTPQQAQAVAEAAMTHGSGMIDLSARANLQLRGVTKASHSRLIADLRAHGLIDPDIESETLRNLIVTPFRTTTPAAPQNPASPIWQGGGAWAHPAPQSADSIDTLAATLSAALAHMPRLPGKFGFAVDAGPRPVLTGASADIRVERAADGALILRPDGHPSGKRVTDLAADVLSLAAWFVVSGGITNGRGRMAALIARGIIPAGYDTPPAQALPPPGPGLHPDGALVALALGQMRAETLQDLAALGQEIRPTPWRMLLLVGATRLPDLPGLTTDPTDPVLRVTACTGAPGCPQALGDTRSLARTLAPHLPIGKTLHLSGCTKGCAHPGPSDLTVVATAQGYDLVRNGTAADTPAMTGLNPAAIPDHLKAPDAPHL